jgi:hypothetical protein
MRYRFKQYVLDVLVLSYKGVFWLTYLVKLITVNYCVVCAYSSYCNLYSDISV